MTNPPTPPTPPKGPKVTVKEPKPNAKPKPADMSKAAKRAAAGAAATAAVTGVVAAGAAAAGVFDSDEETAAAPSMDALDEVVPPPSVAPTDAAPLPDTGDAGAAGGGGPVAHAGGGGGGGAGRAAPSHAASSGPSQSSSVAQAAQATQTAQAAPAAPAAPAAQATATVQTDEASGVAAAGIRTGPATATTADGPATATDGPTTTMAAPEVDALADVRSQLGTTLEGWTPPEGMDPADADALRAQLQQLVTDYEPVDGQSPADATEILLGQIQQQMATYADEHDGTDPAIAVPDAGTLLEGALPDLTDVRSQLGTTLEGWTPPEGMDPADADALRAQLQQLVTDYEPVAGQTPADATEILLGQIQQQMATYADEHDGTDPAIGVPDAGTLLEGGALPDLTDVRAELGTTLEGWTPPEGMDPADADALRAQLQQLVTDYEPVAGQTPADATEILLGQIQQQMATYADEHDGTDPAIPLPDPTTMTDPGMPADPSATSPVAGEELDAFQRTQQALFGTITQMNQDPYADSPSEGYVYQPNAQLASLAEAVRTYAPDPAASPEENAAALRQYLQTQATNEGYPQVVDAAANVNPAWYVETYQPIDLTIAAAAEQVPTPQLNSFEAAQQALFGTISQMNQPIPGAEYLVAWQPDEQLLAIGDAVRTYVPDPTLTTEENAAALREYVQTQATNQGYTEVVDTLATVDPSAYLQQYTPVDLTSESAYGEVPLTLEEPAGGDVLIGDNDWESFSPPTVAELQAQIDALDPSNPFMATRIDQLQEDMARTQFFDEGGTFQEWEDLQNMIIDEGPMEVVDVGFIGGYAEREAIDAARQELDTLDPNDAASAARIAELNTTIEQAQASLESQDLTLEQPDYEVVQPTAAELQAQIDALDGSNPFMVGRIDDLQRDLARTTFIDGGGTQEEWDDLHPIDIASLPDDLMLVDSGQAEWDAIDLARLELETMQGGDAPLDLTDPANLARIEELETTITQAQASLSSQDLELERPAPLSLDDFVDVASVDDLADPVQGGLTDVFDDITAPADDITGMADPSLYPIEDQVRAAHAGATTDDDAFDDITAPAMSQTDDAFDDITAPADDITAPAADVMDDITAQDAPGISETVVDDDDPLGVGDLNDPLGISADDLVPALPDPSGIDPDLMPAIDVDDFSIDGVQEGVPGIEETPMQGVPDLPDLTMPEPDPMHDVSDDLGLPDDLGETPLQQEL